MRGMDDHEGRGVALSFLAQMTFAKGDHARALTLYHEALASLEAVGDHPEIARVHCEMGWTALASADARAAQRAFVRAVHEYEVVGSPRGTGLALLGLAAVEAAEGRPERAVAIAAAAHARCRSAPASSSLTRWIPASPAASRRSRRRSPRARWTGSWRMRARCRRRRYWR